MDSAGHLSKSLRDFIHRLGYSTSKQEELELVQSQVVRFRHDLRHVEEEGLLKNLFSRYLNRDLGTQAIFEHLIRLLYAHMLGLDVTLGCIFAINATQDKSLKVKKLAYLVATRLLVDRPELRILLISSFQRDLSGKNIHELVVVLGAIEKVLDPTVIDGVLDLILPLLRYENDLVRKKAYLIVLKLQGSHPGRIPNYQQLVWDALDDPEFSVKTIGTIMLEQELSKGRVVGEAVERLFRLHDQLMVRNAFSKYAYHRMPNPWVQLRILRCAGMLADDNHAQLF
jgi:hypothetical protein